MNLSSSVRAAVAIVETALKSEQRNQLRLHFEVNTDRNYKDASGVITRMIAIRVADGPRRMYLAMVTLMATQPEEPLEWNTARVYLRTEPQLDIQAYFVKAYSAMWSGQEWLVESIA